MQSNFVNKADLNSRRKQANEKKAIKGQTGKSLGNMMLLCMLHSTFLDHRSIT